MGYDPKGPNSRMAAMERDFILKNYPGRSIRSVLFTLAILFLALPASADEEIPPPPLVAPTPVPTDTPVPFRYRVPPISSDGWAVGDLRREKADMQKITQAVDSINLNKLSGMHSLLVFRHNRLLLEQYFNGADHKTDHPLFSCTKSVFSTVFGIAQDQGLVNVGQKLYDLYPDQRGKAGWDERKADITVGNMLSMTSGLDCNDVGMGDANCGSQMGRSSDWLGFIFALPMARTPGKVWMYNGCCLSLLSNFIAQKSDMTFPEYAKINLLDPLGIAEGDWVSGPGGVNRVDYGLAWKARDMGKLGQLYLNKGMWKGLRVVSESWVRDATTLHAAKGTSFGHSYGYLWHLKDMHYKKGPVPVFFANGYKGQAIFVSPEADLVCVMTADSPDDTIYTKEEQLFEDNILEAFQ